MLAPGLIDLRVKTGEPGAEPKETLKSAARAAAAGGVTSIVVQPDTEPAIDDPSVVDFILRRARDIELVHVYPAGAATKGLAGAQMAELGLMREAGCVYVTDADRPIVNSKVMRRILAYASGLNLLVAHRPADPWLTAGAAATESEFAGRMGLPAAPAAAEKIMLERDAALVELTGARLLVDQVSAACALETSGARQGARPADAGHRLDQPPDLQRARHRRLPHLLEAGAAAAVGGRSSGAGRGAGVRPRRHRGLRPRAGPGRGQAAAVRGGRRRARSAWRRCCRRCSACTTRGARRCSG